MICCVLTNRLNQEWIFPELLCQPSSWNPDHFLTNCLIFISMLIFCRGKYYDPLVCNTIILQNNCKTLVLSQTFFQYVCFGKTVQSTHVAFVLPQHIAQVLQWQKIFDQVDACFGVTENDFSSKAFLHTLSSYDISQHSLFLIPLLQI